MTKEIKYCVCLWAPLVLSACGNKGDLFLLPDELQQQEIEQFQRTLEFEDMPLADPEEVDDLQTTDKSDESKDTNDNLSSAQTH